MDNSNAKSELDFLIPPEIKNDEFYVAIAKIAREGEIKTVLEIGSSSGEGSTEALVKGLLNNPNQPQLFCLEISKTRFEALQKRYESYNFVHCYNLSSVSLEEYPNEQEIINFYQQTPTNLNYYELERILGWLRQGIEYIQHNNIQGQGIQKIKQKHNIDYFDLVLIDGSQFTGKIELNEVYGAKYICLDDTNTFKNYHNLKRLVDDSSYKSIADNLKLRNGYAIFQHRAASGEIGEITKNSLSLPVHFFTIVLNGKPFIDYHIEVFKNLPFQWHWHIIEGVADLKHDTAWTLQFGGQITEEIHCDGLSNDGTTEYLEELIKQYPNNITIYRQPNGRFWDGKKEMVNAPLTNINEECLLWQIDVDELWTLEQLYTARHLFIENPHKTAAFYWCWYFVGKDLVVSSRNCYSQNPQQEWLRTWRYKPGYFWIAHSPPVLAKPTSEGKWENVATINPFSHQETEEQGLLFQHFAYVTPQQLQFKEKYYGYKNAYLQWQALQKQTKFPLRLRQYFPWVKDLTTINKASSCGVLPIAQKAKDEEKWRFIEIDSAQKPLRQQQFSPLIIVDGVFFQLYKTGIARVWQSLLSVWVENGFSQNIIFLDRAGTAPDITGINYRIVPAYSYQDTEADREMLQQICDEEGADLFISTYYTTPISTPSVFMAYDMIPELLGANLKEPMWLEKHRGIERASSFITISENTAFDLSMCFPSIPSELITVAHCGVDSSFSPASLAEINNFKVKYGIDKPYFLAVGISSSYKNANLFFQAFNQLNTKQGFDIVCTGRGGFLPPELRDLTLGTTVHMLQLTDEELRLAYSGAVALVYPSRYEGFGLPIAEAMACSCPVITCPNASIPEVAGKAAIYVDTNSIEEMVNALCEVQKPSVRKSLITKGTTQARNFSWSEMADKVSSALIKTTLLPLNLNKINLIIFPDWLQPEEELGSELIEVLKAIAIHPENNNITLLIYVEDSYEENANLLLSGIAMNLLMEEDLDISEGAEIVPVSNLGSLQWQALLPSLQAKIALKQENQVVIRKEEIAKIPNWKIEEFINLIKITNIEL